jgi:molecular chaperone GrpE
MEKKIDAQNESLKQDEIISEKQSEAPKNEENQENIDDGFETQSELTDDEVIKVKDELAGIKDKYLRLYSEFENFRRRTAKEKIEMVQTANEQLIKSLLPVADDFERAEKSLNKESTDEKELEGFQLIHNKFRKVLEQYGVKPMDIPQGSEFDADTQEAITQIPAPEDNLKGKVVDVIEKGYLLNDKVIRYAKVVVGN